MTEGYAHGSATERRRAAPASPPSERAEAVAAARVSAVHADAEYTVRGGGSCGSCVMDAMSSRACAAERLTS